MVLVWTIHTWHEYFSCMLSKASITKENAGNESRKLPQFSYFTTLKRSQVLLTKWGEFWSNSAVEFWIWKKTKVSRIFSWFFFRNKNWNLEFCARKKISSKWKELQIFTKTVKCCKMRPFWWFSITMIRKLLHCQQSARKYQKKSQIKYCLVRLPPQS